MAAKRSLSYWLPRVLVLIFALSLVLPLPRYLTGMESGELVVWLSRLTWVLILVAVLATLGVLGWWLGRQKKPRPPERH